MTKTDIVILAAGKGTRMRSQLPKVLHKLAGKPMLTHVLDAANAYADAHKIVVTGHGAECVRKLILNRHLPWLSRANSLAPAMQ